MLIHTGASGSGSMQIQIAKALGADVVKDNMGSDMLAKSIVASQE